MHHLASTRYWLKKFVTWLQRRFRLLHLFTFYSSLSNQSLLPHPEPLPQPLWPLLPISTFFSTLTQKLYTSSTEIYKYDDLVKDFLLEIIEKFIYSIILSFSFLWSITSSVLVACGVIFVFLLFFILWRAIRVWFFTLRIPICIFFLFISKVQHVTANIIPTTSFVFWGLSFVFFTFKSVHPIKTSSHHHHHPFLFCH